MSRWPTILFTTLALAGFAPAQAVQLKTGEVVVGEVTDATGDGLTFRRLDNGGLLELRWEDLSSACATQIKRLKGLVVEDGEEIMVEADVIVFNPTGAVREEVVGLIVNETATHIMLKRKSGVLPIPRKTIKKKGRREVPVLEVYTSGEYYRKQLEEIEPGKDADKHIAIAEAMRKVGEFQRSEQHLVRATELGGSRQSTQLSAMLKRVRTLAESAEERELLSQIRAQRNRGNFKRAAELITQFEQTYPDSKLKSDLERERSRFEKAREQALIDQLRQGWDRAVRGVASEKVADRDLDLATARTYAEEQMAKDVFERLARNLDEDADDLANLWANRAKYRKGHSTIYSYGVGSWLLGEEKVIEGTKAAGADEKNKRGTTEDDRELNRLIRKMRENQRRGRRASQNRRTQNEPEETEEDWWKAQNRNDRTTWLRAYFAEYGGQMEIVRAYASACHNCTGTGFLAEQGSTGKELKRDCPVCHKTKYLRSLRAR